MGGDKWFLTQQHPPDEVLTVVPGVSFTLGFSPPPAVAPGPILFLISAAMVMKACSTLVAFLALVSKKGIPRESANSWTTELVGFCYFLCFYIRVNQNNIKLKNTLKKAYQSINVYLFIPLSVWKLLRVSCECCACLSSSWKRSFFYFVKDNVPEMDQRLQIVRGIFRYVMLIVFLSPSHKINKNIFWEKKKKKKDKSDTEERVPFHSTIKLKKPETRFSSTLVQLQGLPLLDLFVFRGRKSLISWLGISK